MRDKKLSSEVLPVGLHATRMHMGQMELVVFSHPIDRGTPVPAPTGLTGAESAVIELLCRGLSYAGIAALRGTSQATVAKQVERAYRKLGVGSRAELVARRCRS